MQTRTSNKRDVQDASTGDKSSFRLRLPSIRCLDRLKTFRGSEPLRQKPKISSPLPLPTNDSDEDQNGFDNGPLRHSIGPGFQVMSDLHLEGGVAESVNSYEQFAIPPSAPYLILAGDIGYFKHKDRYLAFLRRQCRSFVRVFLIPGNHEFYGMSRAEGLQVAADMEKSLEGRLTVMDGKQRRVDVDDNTVLLGCTLYSAGEPDKAYLVNDFHHIMDWTPQQHTDAYSADKDFLEAALKDIRDTKPHSRVLIATHYAPLYGAAIQPKHRDSPLNGFFCSNILEHLLSKALMASVDIWVFGHTHYNMNEKVQHVQVVSNQFRDTSSRRKFRIEATV